MYDPFLSLGNISAVRQKATINKELNYSNFLTRNVHTDKDIAKESSIVLYTPMNTYNVATGFK